MQTRAPVTSTISQDGVLSVAENEANTTLIVKATSVADPEKFDTATVTVLENDSIVSVEVNPADTEVLVGSQKQFTANVESTGSASTEVSWNVIGGKDGTSISPTGLLTIASDETADTLTVRAISKFNSKIYGEANVTVSKPKPIEVFINGEKEITVKLDPGGRYDMTATLLNDTRNQGVDWQGTGFDSKNTLTPNPEHPTKMAQVILSSEAVPDTRYTVKAVSKADNSKFAIVTIVVKQPPFIDVQPNEATVKQGEDFEFTCVIKGFDNENVTWSVEGGTGTTKITPNNQDKKKAILHVDEAQSSDAPLKVKCEGKPNADMEAISDTATVNVEGVSPYELVPLVGTDKTLSFSFGYAFKQNGDFINPPSNGIYSGAFNKTPFGNLGFSSYKYNLSNGKTLQIMWLNSPIPQSYVNIDNSNTYEIVACFTQNNKKACLTNNVRGYSNAITPFSSVDGKISITPTSNNYMGAGKAYSFSTSVSEFVSLDLKTGFCNAINGDTYQGLTAGLSFNRKNNQLDYNFSLSNSNLKNGYTLLSALYEIKLKTRQGIIRTIPFTVFFEINFSHQNNVL